VDRAAQLARQLGDDSEAIVANGHMNGHGDAKEGSPAASPQVEDQPGSALSDAIKSSVDAYRFHHQLDNSNQRFNL
jgi:hypothetical protein